METDTAKGSRREKAGLYLYFPEMLVSVGRKMTVDFDTLLDEIQLCTMLKKAHYGDAASRDAYQDLIREAHIDGDSYRKMYLFYLKERTLREMLEAYIAEMEKIEWRQKQN